MSNSYYKVKAKTKLDDLSVGDRIETSDFATLTDAGNFVQLEYFEEETKVEPFLVKPGTWVIARTMSGYTLYETEFVTDKILEEFVETSHIVEKVDCFFRNLHVYKEYGIEIPRRCMLLFGPPGTGKTTSITKVCQKYIQDGKTAVVIWPTDKLEPHEVKDFIKSFHYDGVEKLLFIIEDIGGVEMEEVRMKSDPSLLSLLDNQEKTFTIPTMILATTNFPEIFLGNLTNRPQRFDDKIRVGFPKPEARAALLKFFSKNRASEEELKKILDNSCNEFSPAHIKEIVIRSAIHSKTILDVIKEMLEEIKIYKKGFNERKQDLGF